MGREDARDSTILTHLFAGLGTSLWGSTRRGGLAARVPVTGLGDVILRKRDLRLLVCYLSAFFYVHPRW